MDSIKQKFLEKAAPVAAEVKSIIKEHGNFVMGEYTLAQVYQGMKGITGLVTETSKLDAEEGIRFRGYSIPEIREKFPKAPNGTEPLPEGVFYLMLIGEIPTEEDVRTLSNELARRSIVPKHVFDVLDSLPAATHPMTQFSIAVMAMQTESLFAAAYRKGVSKKEYWDYTYEDSMNLIARLPRIAAYIYRRKYKNNEHIEPDHKLDWAANLAHMMGYEDFDVKRLMRLYMTIHADHEGGNVSAHTTHLVGSALSDPYLSFAAGMNGLAGPLHGLANQEVIIWIMNMREELGGGLPTKEQIAAFIQKTLSEGKVVPGYGHAVLRKTDPRFTAQQNFYKKYIKDQGKSNDLCEIVQMVYEVAPPILEATGKIKNPWPNVDAHSGALLMHFDIKEFEFYTVLFGVSRALGVLASLCWDRAIGHPIERPGSTTTELIKKKIGITA
ncbi:MAG: citrate (Si)-synthase, eukaryotic [Bacteroidetes bacterium]|nr:citrate (Si)-synthase, eukaryotic [Bacteroidota bacterium]MBV6460994.1 Citrate synthase [Flavobacteriales bacterium]WKZ75608.1 MAG: citrate (Si)-synthase, eukaryotic [Vicingaceae bacterium]MCL4815174.1 citrate (Si)-synthase, eukaryotic [Flavobacteriales bacterium]NOG94516.1 citrate (Si)-synthase, eukaryotic [Bacteroidota bacterium]